MICKTQQYKNFKDTYQVDIPMQKLPGLSKGSFCMVKNPTEPVVVPSLEHFCHPYVALECSLKHAYMN